MNRRSFFRNLAMSVGVAAAPGLFLPKLTKVQWKRTLAFNPRDFYGEWKWVENPAYERAKYKFSFTAQPRFTTPL